MGKPSIIIIIIIISTFFPLSTPYSDFEALLSFKQSIHEDPQQSLSSWNQTTHFCTWKGVSCTKTPRNRVLSLTLPSQGLVGTLSPHVANLSFLTTFILQNNSFHGPIPEEIGRLERLRVIEFSNNSFQGEIPTNLSQCSRLYYLNLIDNRLTGAVPPEIGSSLLDLEDLGLTSNMLSGTIPPSLGNLTKLLQLSLANCGLSGEIPESMSRLRRLKWFTLRQNSLSGRLPLSFNNLTEMVLFSLYSNRIQGTIPPDLLTLPKLRTLDLSTNHFTGSLPSSLSNSSRIEYLSVESNSLAGDMVDLTRLSGLKEFGVASNSLKGDIGTILSSLTNSTRLGALVLADNLFTGSLPDSVANLSTHLYLLNIKQNHLSGTIPSGVGGLVTLTALSLGDNGLEGPIPRSIGKLRKLQGISLLGNKLAGEVPSSFGNLSLLNHLRLGQNRLSGRIPRSLGNCSSLSSLDLSENYFNGSIPHEVMSLSSISLFIDLSRNVLSGDIPSQVGALKSLGYMDLSHNRLSGTIPTSLSSCVMLNELCLEGNLLRGEIPESLSALKSLQYLDLSQNNISGRIPRFLVDFKLIYLNLSFNALQGEVPNHGVFQNQSAISLQGNHGLCGGIAFLNLPPCSSPHPSSNKLVKVLIPVAAGGVCLALAACLCIIVYRRRTKQQEGESPREMLDLMRLSYADLLNATSGFVDSNLIGGGRFGCVYKGTIVNDDGGGERVVAVKVLRLDIRGAFKSLASECNALRGLRHRNLLKIVSVCDSIDFQGNDFKALVYEFMANGSLEDWLHRNSEERSRGVLSFAQRLDAAIDVASAVEYLHGGTDSIVIHGDLKPSNILLDRDMVARVGDFGLAKIISSSSEGRSSSTAAIKGTIGYIAPEYGMNDVVSTQGDAYSYGILLLEMFTNTRPTSTDAFKGYANLQDFVSSTFPDRVTEVVDPLLHQQLNQDDNKYWDCIVSILRIGVRCSMESPRDRMSMAEAVNDLKNIRSIFLADRKGRNVAPCQH